MRAFKICFWVLVVSAIATMLLPAPYFYLAIVNGLVADLMCEIIWRRRKKESK